MSNNSDIVFTPAARMAQAQRGSARAYEKRVAAGFSDRVTPEVAGFIAELDTAFLGTVSARFRPTAAHQALGTRARGRRRSDLARAAQRPGLSRPAGARDPVHRRGMGRELLAAYQRPLHRGRGGGGYRAAARENRGVGS